MRFEDHTLIHYFLENSARIWPDKTALVHGEVRATFAQVNSAANQLAGWLVGRGVVPGDRVVLLLENGLEYVVSYYAALKAGAVAVPLNSELKADGLIPLLGELEPAIVISSAKFERLLKAAKLETSTARGLVLKNPRGQWPSAALPVYSWDELVRDEATADLNVSVSSGAIGSIIYTSGSTGRPKGVMLTHRNIVTNVRSICQYLQLTENDIQMVVLPFFYVMGKSLLNTHFAVGGTIVINNQFAFPAAVVKQMAEEKVTGFSGVPSTYAYLLHQSPLHAYRDRLGSLRYCSQAGGHMARTIKEQLLRVLPDHTRLVVMYGATEASARLAYVEPDRLLQKVESIGRPIPGVTIRVLDPNGHELPNGQVGEIVASGANIMQGYWRNSAATEIALSHHGYHTGDLGYRDEDGYFFAVGRKDNQLKVGGHRINPQEIEDVIMTTGLAVEVVVLGLPDPLLGNKLVAAVVPAGEGASTEALLALCSAKIPRFKLPQDVLFVRTLPKNPSGKIDKNRCKELFG